jgi:hypothetical protein
MQLNSIASNKLCIIGIDVCLKVLLHLGHLAGSRSIEKFSSYQSKSALVSLYEESWSIDTDGVADKDLLKSTWSSFADSIEDD